ncbi:hypothetical protein J2S46_003651 [Kitasatospora herbaricolor]|nr:hypothetical protein [Kitasatospora herbaricolor]
MTPRCAVPGRHPATRHRLRERGPDVRAAAGTQGRCAAGHLGAVP